MPTLKALKIADDMKIGNFVRDWYVIKFLCPCGHEREPRGEYIRRVIGAQITLGQLKQRLRCHKCGRHQASIEVFQLPR